MNNASKVALLKLIRDNEPISLVEIRDLIETNPELRSVFAYRHLHENIGGYSWHPVEDLFSLGLIELHNNEEFSPNAKLKTTKTLPRLQELFRFSLSALTESGENPIYVTPTLGRPKPNKDAAQVFVAMPFRDELLPVYQDHILTVTNRIGLSCRRGDDFSNINRVMDDVWTAIFNSQICIADCTGKNANVFYELGLAHTLGKKAILISQSESDVPFNIKDRRVILYEFTPRGMSEFEDKLERTIRGELSLH